MTRIFQFFDDYPRTGRLLILLSIPVWVPLAVACVILYMGFLVFCTFTISPVYWVITGKSFLYDVLEI